MPLQVAEHRGWEVVRLASDRLRVDVVPGKGGDILGARSLRSGIDVLWRSPWGLRPAGAVPTGGDSVATFMEHYPGGWQTIFPNGGSPSVEGGVEWGFHGEASLVPWEWSPVDGEDAIDLTARMTRSPFTLRRRVRVQDGRLEVTETVENTGAAPIEAMWSHHPAFGAPFLSGACRIDTAAARFVVDHERDVPAGDLEPGVVADWPWAPTRDGGKADLRVVPADGEPLDRFGYLTDLERGWAKITNDELRISVELEWDHTVMPHAWLWLEARSTLGYPWYGQAYVLAIEPATSFPGHGLAVVRERTGTQVVFEPGVARTAVTSLSIEEDG